MKTFCLLLFFSSITFAQSDTSIVFIGNIDSTIHTDVKYATSQNFTGRILYPTSKVFIRKCVADSLKKANEYLLKNFGYRLKIFDGYRPLSVQKLMWSVFPDDRYVANPKTGSRHNRGAAVDLTIIDTSGIELDMGTPYDDFTEKAHSDFIQLPEKVLANRKLLSNVMQKFGFIPLSTEWWHFDFKDWKNFSILDTEIN
jgi:D-alanyl-D-alanine dipeptidase